MTDGTAAGAAPEPERRDPPVLPDQTGDDLDVGWGEHPEERRDDDERFLRERPPHWE